MTDKQINSLNLQISNYFDKKTQTKSRNYRKYCRNIRRRNRRKRSKSTYYTNLKQVRIKRRTDELSTTFSIFDIKEMDWSPIAHPTNKLLNEVNEWQRHEQIAYWKSKALSLELENRMLQDHLRKVYAKQTENYAKYLKEEKLKSISNNNKKVKEECKIVESKPENFKRQRRVEMLKMYGEMSPKIMGMETAVQLNYERVESNLEPSFWPNVPLNF